MKIAYLDCFSGISGDMVLGALVDAGASFEHLESELRRLPVPGWSIRAEEVKRRGLRAKKVTVESGEHHPHRGLQEILAMIAAAGFAPGVTDRATRIFARLGDAEAAIHGVPVERIHFHEVGAVDSIVDIVGAAIGFEALSIEQVFCSPLNVGGGRVQTSHGMLPVPAPATAALLQGAPTYSSGSEMELVTPTGAAIVATMAKRFGAQPAMRVESTGYGAGTADPKEQANVLRVIIGKTAEGSAGTALEDGEVPGVGEVGSDWEAPITVLEANVDDMNPQIYGYFAERALAVGALDVFAAPVQMKKGRPGMVVTVLCKRELRDLLADMMLRETTTIGVRMHEARRRTLARETVTVSTPMGAVQVKIARQGNAVLNVAPEYEDCSRIAREKNVPLKEVMAEAMAAFQKQQGNSR